METRIPTKTRKRVRLIPDWHKQIHRLWTSRLAIFGVAVGGAGEVLPWLQDYLPPKWYIALFFIILIARFIAQPNSHD